VRAALQQRVARAHGAHEVVAVDGLHPHLGPGGGAQHAQVQVDQAFAQGAHVLVGLGRKAQAHAGGLAGGAGHQGGGKGFDEAVVGAQGEGAFQRGQVPVFARGLQHGGGVPGQGLHLLAQGLGVRGEHHGAAGAHQQRVAGGGAQAGQGAAHGRFAQLQALGGAGHAGFGEQRVQRGQQVQVGGGGHGCKASMACHAGAGFQPWRGVHE
jgi:hypothetical protein